MPVALYVLNTVIALFALAVGLRAQIIAARASAQHSANSVRVDVLNSMITVHNDGTHGISKVNVYAAGIELSEDSQAIGPGSAGVWHAPLTSRPVDDDIEVVFLDSAGRSWHKDGLRQPRLVGGRCAWLS